MAEHIKWQKTANKKYFGSWDLPDDGKDMIVTIEDVKREMVPNQQGNEDFSPTTAGNQFCQRLEWPESDFLIRTHR